MTDGPQLQQVFLNLLNNSLDAIYKEGTIEIRTYVESRGPDKIEPDTIAIDFSDTGPGMDAEVIQKIFDPFFTTKGPDKGTGLGMSISYDIMQKLGGNIVASNKIRGGAAFKITLPILKLGDANK
jgi:two-component system NtrC family sensor kinase